jgi:pimeloyl-ACP methyl ester carboxylesterase
MGKETEVAPSAARSGRGFGRRFVRWVALVVVLFLVVFGAAAFYFSGQIGSDGLAVSPTEPDYSTKVALVEDGAIYLDPEDANAIVEQDGTFGIRWSDGWGRIGAIEASDDSENLVRRIYIDAGDGAPANGAKTDLSNDAFYGNPREALDLPFGEVSITGELGEMPAYLVPGTSKTWVIYTHGKGASRTEGYRALRTLNALDYPGLLITYRNDEGAPADPTNQYGYGLREWKDLEAAVQYALDNGADDVVLAGWSMGGAITGQFLSKSPLAKDVRGVILDSPALDLPASIRLGASQRTLPLTPWAIPDVLTTAAMQVADWRYPTDVTDAVAIDPVVSFDGPVFLAHGTADTVVPVSVSDEVATRRGPDRTTYLRVADAEHTAAWNHEPDGYDTELKRWAEAELTTGN